MAHSVLHVGVLYDYYETATDMFAVFVFILFPISILSCFIVFMRDASLKREGIQPEDSFKTLLQIFFSLMFTVAVFYLLFQEKISLGDGIPLFISILIYAWDKFSLVFRRKQTVTMASPADELAKWKALLDAGVVSEAEYRQQKEKILHHEIPVSQR